MKKVILLILVVLALGVVVATASADPPSFPANVSQLCFDLEENQASYPFDSHGECVAYLVRKCAKWCMPVSLPGSIMDMKTLGSVLLQLTPLILWSRIEQAKAFV